MTAAKASQKITIAGKTYDLEDLPDAQALQRQLVPDNWPGKKADCVRLFLSTANMLTLDFRRHLAANWKKICKQTQEEVDEGGAATIKIGYGFELNQTAPSVAAFSDSKMSYGVKHSTTSNPQSHDINQGEFLDENLAVVLDIKGFNAEQEQPETPTAEEPAKPDEAAAPGAESPVPDPTAGGDVTAENTPGDKPARKRGKRKA